MDDASKSGVSNRLCVAAVSVSVLAIAVLTWYSHRNRIAEDRAIARVKDLGGNYWESRVTITRLGVLGLPESATTLISKFMGRRPIARLRYLKITDSDLEPLRHIPRLRSLDLSGTKIADNGLRHLVVLNNLQSLDLSGTRVTDGCVEYLIQLRSLKRLGLRGTQISQSGRTRIQNANPDLNLNWPVTINF